MPQLPCKSGKLKAYASPAKTVSFKWLNSERGLSDGNPVLTVCETIGERATSSPKTKRGVLDMPLDCKKNFL